jgi:hypothetical protein
VYAAWCAECWCELDEPAFPRGWDGGAGAAEGRDGGGGGPGRLLSPVVCEFPPVLCACPPRPCDPFLPAPLSPPAPSLGVRRRWLIHWSATPPLAREDSFDLSGVEGSGGGVGGAAAIAEEASSAVVLVVVVVEVVVGRAKEATRLCGQKERSISSQSVEGSCRSRRIGSEDDTLLAQSSSDGHR